FIRRIMEKMGFENPWVDKVMACIESVSYSVLINGTPQETFTPKRGIRQGDPISPYIFLFCAEGLTSLLNKEERLDHFRGLRINNHCPSLSHLFFCRR
ncbi:MAG: reverse transcriptase domain-containing protein, partial [Sweet potato little leaf phytoplasma]|nr:reverse transcriptase domain-containing protein [Sweet potato little leaf phytoplasma]